MSVDKAITCDQCRTRKVRCNPELGACRNCTRRSEKCTFEYTPKKPGRPRAPTAQKRRRTDSCSVSPLSSETPMTITPALPPALNATAVMPSPHDQLLSPGPVSRSIFGSARHTLQALEFDYTLPVWTRQHTPELDLDALAPLTDTLAMDPALTVKSLEEYSPSTTIADLVAASESAPASETIDIRRIENFASWDEIGFFLSLHMKHQHMLVPLVHRPSFAQDVLHRRDEEDEAFRGLLLSMVAYTIAQCPINWLLGRMGRRELESLLERCQRGSRLILIRHHTRPSLIIMASTILDCITSQSAAPAEVAANLMTDVRRLIYSLNLNREVPREGLTPLELDIGRRLFWEAYAIDKTNALNGHPIQLLDMDGTPPLPLEIDDEYLSPHAAGEQPEDRLSYMAGFLAISRLFKVLSACLVRHRTLLNDPDSAFPPEAQCTFVDRSLEYVRALRADMPPALQPDNASADTVLGTQAANVYITALCIELALLDLRAKVADDDGSRHEIAQTVFQQLEGMPLECLASNGESMRGKVFRVILALLNATPEGALGDGLWDWWNMYSRVQFIQLMPEVNRAPKKQKAQKMALSEFFSETGGVTSWADEMETLPTAPAARDPLAAPRRGEPGYLDSMPDRGAGARFGGPQREELPLPTIPPFTAFIGNLTFETEDDQLREFFADIAPLSVRLVKDLPTGKSKGFGYVEFSSQADLKAALDRSGANLAGRSIRVNVADAPASRSGRDYAPSVADESNSWRRVTPLPARDPPRRTFSGVSSAAGSEDRDWGAARGAKFVPSSRESSGYGRPRDVEPMHSSAADDAGQWRSTRPLVNAAPERGAGGPGGRDAPPHRPTGLADTESTWSRGTRVPQNAAPAEPTRQRLKLAPSLLRPLGCQLARGYAVQGEPLWRSASGRHAHARGKRRPPRPSPPAPKVEKEERRPVRVHPSRMPQKEVAQADEDGFEAVGPRGKTAPTEESKPAAKPVTTKTGFSFAAAAGKVDVDVDDVADKVADVSV
ncbi:hypothetical protein CcaverHIS631_0300880 [Cutaneotrichosporon cavernicola]|nr:hypothetical protein CcaverHIS631_0300880 [Cutaneotrichosporon cavernicola]